MKNFDELLDEVLREDGQAMPRPGMETRVMARLHADERPTVRSVKAWWWTAMAMAAAACVVAAVVWVVPRTRNMPTLKIKHPVIAESGRSGRASRDAHLTTPPSSWRGPRSSDDKAVAKMGHPIVVAPKSRRSPVAQQSRLPKLETFPAVTQKGEVAAWLGGSDAKLAAVVQEMSPQALKAYRDLQESQSQPLTIAAIEIKPLQ